MFVESSTFVSFYQTHSPFLFWDDLGLGRGVGSGISPETWLSLAVRPSRLWSNLGHFIWSVAVLGALGVSIGHQSISLGPRMKALDYLLACNLWFPPKNDLYALGLYKPDLSSRPNMIMILTRSISITLIKDEAKSLPWRNIKSTLIWFYLQLEFS